MHTEHVYDTSAKHYPIRYSVWDYQFPIADTIASVHFDDKYIHIELTDERLLSIPLHWIPPLRDARVITFMPGPPGWIPAVRLEHHG